MRLRKGPGVEGRRGEGRGNAAGIEVIEKRALLVKLFFFFFKFKASGPSEDPSVNFLKNVGESVAAALSPLGECLPVCPLLPARPFGNSVCEWLLAAFT